MEILAEKNEYLQTSEPIRDVLDELNKVINDQKTSVQRLGYINYSLPEKLENIKAQIDKSLEDKGVNRIIIDTIIELLEKCFSVTIAETTQVKFEKKAMTDYVTQINEVRAASKNIPPQK